MTTNMLEMENKKTYTLSYPKKSPDDNDITVTDTTISKVVFTNSRIIFTSQTDTWISSTQKSKTVLKWIYDGSFSFTGNTLATIKSSNIDQITFAGHGSGYDTRSDSTTIYGEGAGSFRFDAPYKNLNTALLDTVKGSLLYNYSSTGENTLVPFLGGRLFASSSVPVSTDRSVITGEIGNTELKTNWWADPFSPSNGTSGSSSGSGGSSTTQTLTTTSSVDTLTGIKKKKDIFRFDADPSGQVDKVTGFNAKEKDVLSISKSAFEIDRGTFAVAKNAKALAKQLGTSVDIVYNRQTGELILNANGAEPGYGDDGGVFAVLVGRPTVGSGSVQFY